MYQDNITLCGASAYEKKFYFNQDFNALPDHVKKELQIMCVLYTEDVGGILTLEFDEDGKLRFKTEALEADARYDEIGCGWFTTNISMTRSRRICRFWRTFITCCGSRKKKKLSTLQRRWKSM